VAWRASGVSRSRPGVWSAAAPGARPRESRRCWPAWWRQPRPSRHPQARSPPTAPAEACEGWPGRASVRDELGHWDITMTSAAGRQAAQGQYSRQPIPIVGVQSAELPHCQELKPRWHAPERKGLDPESLDAGTLTACPPIQPSPEGSSQDWLGCFRLRRTASRAGWQVPQNVLDWGQMHTVLPRKTARPGRWTNVLRWCP
jgi:hypothetical protein